MSDLGLLKDVILLTPCSEYVPENEPGGQPVNFLPFKPQKARLIDKTLKGNFKIAHIIKDSAN